MAVSRAGSSSATNKTDPFAMLEEIASNLWWTWDPQALQLFRHADGRRFTASHGNGVVVARQLSAGRKRTLAKNEGYLAEVARVYDRLQKYLRGRTWFSSRNDGKVRGVTAYFCMEYGLHESLPLYAGGLGILAGDHLKSASDLGIPFVAVGIYWHRGYTRQRIGKTGEQQDRFPRLALKDTSLREVTGGRGRPVRVKVKMGDDSVMVRAWLAHVGRVQLILLDTNLPQNAARHRRIVDVLYSGDRDMRIRQEILLGVGGWRMLQAMRVPVAACHLNEGHAAFLSLERIAEHMHQVHCGFSSALEAIRESTVFTTHTPVPEGNEAFDPDLVDQYLGDYAHRLGLSRQAFLDLGRVEPDNVKELFGMTPLALRTSRYANGVAALHGQVARKMWKPLYRVRKLDDVPIGHVTNGIHLRTWLNPRMGSLLDDTLGDDWEQNQDLVSTWKRIERIDEQRLWDLRQQLKADLVAFCRQRLAAQWRRNGAGRGRLAEVDHTLDPEALTIGFARRFAPYKRATLVFSDPRQFARILNDRQRPVQIIFAGKAHPSDVPGKALVRQIARWSSQARFRHRVVFIEDYDIEVARHMVAGVDVWLNNPQRPREASGTSGMKPALHGGLNLSILDGWWPEGFSGTNGWAIGRARDHDGTRKADRRDAADLYRLLETRVVPLYYQRSPDGLPRRWIARMKNALTTVPPFFNTHRQVKQYLQRYYLPAMRASVKIKP